MINHVTKNEADGAAIGARLRRLSERIDREATAIYADLDIAFEQRWYGPLNLIAERGTASVTDIARLLGISHSAVSQARRSLVLAGFVEERADPSDKRSRLLSLSGKGAALIGSLAPVECRRHVTGFIIQFLCGAVQRRPDRGQTADERRAFARQRQ